MISRGVKIEVNMSACNRCSVVVVLVFVVVVVVVVGLVGCVVECVWYVDKV
jgi:hypothetical protein